MSTEDQRDNNLKKWFVSVGMLDPVHLEPKRTLLSKLDLKNSLATFRAKYFPVFEAYIDNLTDSGISEKKTRSAQFEELMCKFQKVDVTSVHFTQDQSTMLKVILLEATTDHHKYACSADDKAEMVCAYNDYCILHDSLYPAQHSALSI